MRVKLVFLAFCFLVCSTRIQSIAQQTFSEDSLKSYEGKTIPVYSATYMREYRRLKRVILKVYPYAIYAADVVDRIEHDAVSIKKRRKKNKFYKSAYKELKDDFKYALLDMYQSEGRMLMKLVHRETGSTVFELTKKYRGADQANFFNTMGKMWNQDLKITFDAEGDDKIAEHVIRDIQDGLIDYNPSLKKVSKDEYKEGMEEYRDNKKEHKKRQKEKKKKQRKQAGIKSKKDT